MTKNGLAKKPSLNSSDPVEHKYAKWLSKLKAMKHGTHPFKSPKVLMNLENAEEWLSPVEYDSIEYISSQWEKMIDFTGELFPSKEKRANLVDPPGYNGDITKVNSTFYVETCAFCKDDKTILGCVSFSLNMKKEIGKKGTITNTDPSISPEPSPNFNAAENAF